MKRLALFLFGKRIKKKLWSYTGASFDVSILDLLERKYRWIINAPISQWRLRLWCVRHSFYTKTYDEIYDWITLSNKSHPIVAYEAPQEDSNKTYQRSFVDGLKGSQETSTDMSPLYGERSSKGTGFDEIPEASKMRLSNKFPDGTYLVRVPPYVAIYIPQGLYETFRLKVDYFPGEIGSSGLTGRNGSD